jgi:hypothetical protein
MQQEEVAALVDWVLQMPPEWPLTPPLKDRVLQAVAAQISGQHQRCAGGGGGRLTGGLTRLRLTLGGLKFNFQELVWSRGRAQPWPHTQPPQTAPAPQALPGVARRRRPPAGRGAAADVQLCADHRDAAPLPLHGARRRGGWVLAGRAYRDRG